MAFVLDQTETTTDIYYRTETGPFEYEYFKIIEKGYNRKLLADKLVDTIEYQLANLTQIRNQNFTGAMLRHHHHKSTQYMSQWIEAKNKLK